MTLVTLVTRESQVYRVPRETGESVEPSVSLVLRALMDVQDLLVMLASRDYKVLLVLLEPQALLAHRVTLAHPVSKEHRVTLDSSDSAELKDDRVPRAQPVSVDLPVKLAVMAKLALRVLTDHQAQPEPRDHQEMLVSKVHQDSQDPVA